MSYADGVTLKSFVTKLATILAVTSSFALANAESGTQPIPDPCTVHLTLPSPGDQDLILNEGDLRLYENGKAFWKNSYIRPTNHKNTNFFARGRQASFTDTEQRILLALVDRANSVVSQETIINDVWPEEEFGTRQIDSRINLITHIGTIKKLFKSVDPAFNSLKTIRSTGYIWKSNTGLEKYQGDNSIVWKGHTIVLTRHQFLILKKLREHPNTPTSIIQLYRATQEGQFEKYSSSELDEKSTSETIGQQIRKIRRKFELVDPEFRSIGILRGEGYFWTPFT